MTAAWVKWDNFVKSIKAIYLAVIEGKVQVEQEANITVKKIDLVTDQVIAIEKFKAPKTDIREDYSARFKTALRSSLPVVRYFADIRLRFTAGKT